MIMCYNCIDWYLFDHFDFFARPILKNNILNASKYKNQIIEIIIHVIIKHFFQIIPNQCQKNIK
jgi:hypothetical protein